jgi:hypothetical protein
VAAAGGPPSPVDAGATVVVTACELEAWSTDTDPQGLAVRAGPGVDAPAIARLPPPTIIQGDAYATQVSITGAKDGWFRIGQALVVDYVGEQATQVVFEGEGWVSGRFLGLALNDATLHATPSRRAPAVARLVDEGGGTGPDTFVVARLHACQGRWADVEGTFLGTRLRGWATRTCANQVTTCP